LDVAPSRVEEALIEPEDVADIMDQFDDLVEAIKEQATFSRGLEYDQIGWRYQANRWSLTETATRIQNNRSIDDF
jgi:hypothetical protein